MFLGATQQRTPADSSLLHTASATSLSELEWLMNTSYGIVDHRSLVAQSGEDFEQEITGGTEAVVALLSSGPGVRTTEDRTIRKCRLLPAQNVQRFLAASYDQERESAVFLGRSQLLIDLTTLQSR